VLAFFFSSIYNVEKQTGGVMREVELVGKDGVNKVLLVDELTGEQTADLLELVEDIDLSEVRKSWRTVFKTNKYLVFKLLAKIFNENEDLFKKQKNSKLKELIEALWLENEAVTKNLSGILTSQAANFLLGFITELTRSKDSAQPISGNA